MDAHRPVSYDLTDHLGMLRRHWWVVVLLTLAGVAGGAAVAGTRPRVYEAATSVLVTPTGVAGANAAGGRTNGAINLDTEAQIVVSTDIATAAQKLLKVATPPDQLAANVTVAVPANTTVLTVTYAAGSPREAQSGSHAFAIAYLQNRQTTAQADLSTQISALDARVKQYSASLSQLSSRLATLKSGDPDKADLNSQIATLTQQINTLTSRENELSTTQVIGGKIINDAEAPTNPARPSVPLFLASGAMVGLLLGIGTGLIRERTDQRVRRAGDVARRDEVPLLAVLPTGLRPRLDDVYPAAEPAGRTFHRLRNEALASLDEGDRVIVVTGASVGVAATLVAANLAAALARAGTDVVLIRAQPGGILGVPAAPGLCEVLAGSVGLEEAIRPAPRIPNLRVLTAGGAASAAGLLQPQPLRAILARLRTGTAYVVIEAPSAAASADAQSLASQGDAAILAVELRTTRHAEILDAAEQLDRVGTRLLGAVVFPRLRRPVTVPQPVARGDVTVVLPRVEEEAR